MISHFDFEVAAFAAGDHVSISRLFYAKLAWSLLLEMKSKLISMDDKFMALILSLCIRGQHISRVGKR